MAHFMKGYGTSIFSQIAFNKSLFRLGALPLWASTAPRVISERAAIEDQDKQSTTDKTSSYAFADRPAAKRIFIAASSIKPTATAFSHVDSPGVLLKNLQSEQIRHIHAKLG